MARHRGRWLFAGTRKQSPVRDRLRTDARAPPGHTADKGRTEHPQGRWPCQRASAQPRVSTVSIDHLLGSLGLVDSKMMCLLRLSNRPRPISWRHGVSEGFPTFPFVFRRFQRFPGPRNVRFQAFPRVSKRFHSFPNISKRFQAPVTNAKGLQTFPFVSKRFHSFPNVPKHFQAPEINVSKWWQSAH